MLSMSCHAQAVAAQHQLQYQAAAMQAQAMHAAAANAAWNQSNNPYLSGLCFPYNLYGAAAPQQLYAAYARCAAPPGVHHAFQQDSLFPTSLCALLHMWGFALCRDVVCALIWCDVGSYVWTQR